MGYNFRPRSTSRSGHSLPLDVARFPTSSLNRLNSIITVDGEICAEVAENPQNYLVPHPTDCTKFFSCQSLGGRRGHQGWKAHLMDCPPTTGFDTNLRICNYLRSLPRCNDGTGMN